MTNRPTVAAVAALLLPGLVACIPYDHDVTERVAVSGQKVVVTGQTVTEGGGGCGGGDIGGTPVMLISNDAGQSFERVADGGAPIRDLITLDGAFIMLRSDYASFSVLRSIDGHTWDLLGTNDGDGNDLAVFGDDLVVASSLGVHLLPLTGDYPRAWTNAVPSDAGLYAPHVVAVDDTLVVVTNAGQIFTSTDAAQWNVANLPTGTSAHGVSAIAGRVVVDAHATDADGVSSAVLVAFAPDAPEAAETIIIDEGAGAVIDLPIGVLVGDGSLGATLAARAPHVDGFTAAAADDGSDEVVLLQDAALRLSVDGGATFGAALTLPLLDER